MHPFVTGADRFTEDVAGPDADDGSHVKGESGQRCWRRAEADENEESTRKKGEIHRSRDRHTGNGRPES